MIQYSDRGKVRIKDLIWYIIVVFPLTSTIKVYVGPLNLILTILLFGLFFYNYYRTQMFFMKVEFHSDFINRVAKHVFAVYLFEGALRQIVQNIVFDYSIYEGEWYWPLVNIAVALIAMVGCMSIDVLAQWMLKPFRKAALKMLGVIINISQKIFICY